ncbi:MAG: MBL fold metallo-hydrolase [Thermoplasmata archaeon]|nr:MAG: MBL fold metallo-hydrolase [Thermoplasmata archaeon]
MRLTIMVDDLASEGWRTASGFAALVETAEATLLFDTGPDGEVIVDALDAAGVEVADLDLVVVSHDHPDHTGGLSRLLYDRPRIPVSAPIDVAPSVAKTLPREAVVLGERGPRQLFPNLRTTGSLSGGVAEQALVMSTERGEVVVTGCLHAGLGMLLAAVEGNVVMVVGGFHELTDDDIGLTSLDDMIACHCTPRKRILAHDHDWISVGGSGTVLEFVPPPQFNPRA